MILQKPRVSYRNIMVLEDQERALYCNTMPLRSLRKTMVLQYHGPPALAVGWQGLARAWYDNIVGLLMHPFDCCGRLLDTAAANCD